ncbi:MAG: class I SAM-dependent methyltransferase [Planctomycetota bacterium]|nr:class I SAM-dependent methyltransferase [Planctomycetota bacterium]
MSGLYHRLRRRSLVALESCFPREGLIVDLGCGSGALAFALCDAAPGRRVLAVDHEPARIAALERAKGERPIETRVADMGAIEMPPCIGVALIDVLHYFREHEQTALLARAARALEPGGVLVLRDPDADAGLRFTWNRFHEHVATTSGFTRAAVHHYRTAVAWAAQLESLGLEPELGEPARGLYADRVVRGRRP